MSDADSRGPQVDSSEDLYRAIVSPKWWDSTSEPAQVRSFAFKVDSPFSVNVASRMSLPDAIRHMCEVLHEPRGGIVSFNCGEARFLGFDARHELDPKQLDNAAHANVYYDGTTSSRKRKAKKLAQACVVRHPPSF